MSADWLPWWWKQLPKKREVRRLKVWVFSLIWRAPCIWHHWRCIIYSWQIQETPTNATYKGKKLRNASCDGRWHGRCLTSPHVEPRMVCRFLWRNGLICKCATFLTFDRKMERSEPAQDISIPVKIYVFLLHMLLLFLVLLLFKRTKKDAASGQVDIDQSKTRTVSSGKGTVTIESCQWLNSTLTWFYLHSLAGDTPNLVKLWLRAMNRHNSQTE